MSHQNILFGFEDCYVLNNKTYRTVKVPTNNCLSLAIIDPIQVTPNKVEGVKENNMGHFEGPIELVEQFQSQRLVNTINTGIDLDKILLKIKRVLYLEETQTVPKNKNHKKDLLLCEKSSVEKLSNTNLNHDLIGFELFDGEKYVGKDLLEIFPLFLTLSVSYDDLVLYLKSINLYFEKWPYTHVWQNGCDFAQMMPSITGSNLRIWTLGYFHSFNSLYVRDNLFPKLGEKDYALVVDWGAVYPASSLLISKSKYPQNIYWLANGKLEYEFLKSQGVNAKIVSHNAFINDKVFSYNPNIKKKYNAIFCQSVIPFKRPALAKKIPNMVYSTGGEPIIEYQKMINDQRGDLFVGCSPNQVASLMNQSHCGLSLSQAEGGNYATTEYLLCGLPVITTKNIGGRDIYLNETNSITIDEDTPEAVLEAVNYILQNLEKYDPNKIRQQALDKNREMIETLKKEILTPIFALNNVDSTQINSVIESILSVNKESSKGRTVLQPEYAMIRV
jgi:glycosyltransferase involved in cell wall biosynthesis